MDKQLHSSVPSKIFAYRRVSTKKQKQSFENQKRIIENYAEQFNLHIDEWFEDYAVSASKNPMFERHGYMSMEEAIECHFWTHNQEKPLVLTTSINRLSRCHEDDSVTLMCLLLNKAQVIGIDDNQNASEAMQKAMNFILKSNINKENKALYLEHALMMKHIALESCFHYE